MAKVCALFCLMTLAVLQVDGVRPARTALRFKQLLKVAMNQNKVEEVVGTGITQPYGPWTSKNFSVEAIKNSPCAQDGKSSAFDKFKQDRGPSKNTSNETLLMEMGQPYGPWTSKNFSKEAIRQSPCAQDGKSSAFDKFKQDRGPSKNTSNETLFLQRH